MHLFCPTMCFSLPDPDFCCHSLSSVSLYCLLSIVYSSRERCHLSLSATVFPGLCAWIPFSFPFRVLCPPLLPYGCLLWSSPSVWGASSLSYPSWCFMDLCLARWGFLFVWGFFWSYSPHWTLRFLPQQRRCPPFCPPCSEYLDNSVLKFDGKSCLHLNFSF